MINFISSQVIHRSFFIEKYNDKVIFVERFISADKWSNVVEAKTFNGAALWF